MRRQRVLAGTLRVVAIMAALAAGAGAEEFSPNTYWIPGLHFSPGQERFANSATGEMYANAMLGSISIQRQFRSVLPSIYNYSQTAHRQNRADVGSDAAYASATAASAVCPTTMCAPGSKWVMWDSPFYMDETRKRDEGFLGYRNRTVGFATGISRMLGETSAIGLALGYDSRKLDSRDGYHMRYRGDAFHAALYGGAAIGHFFVDAYAGYSHAWNRSERLIENSPSTLLKTNYKDTVLSTGLKASYVWILGNDARITPSIGLDYSHVRVGPFRERSYGGTYQSLAMVAYKSTYQNLSVPIMVSLNRTFAYDFLTFKGAPSLWTPEVRGGWVPQLGAKHAGMRASLPVGIPYVDYFRPQSSPLVRSYGTVGAGLKVKLADRFIFAVDYDYSFASKYSKHSLTATYGVSF